jgi:hypothetical protein
MNSFLNYCPYSYHSSNYLYGNISCSVFLLTENLTLLPLRARKSNNYCYWKNIKEQRMLSRAIKFSILFLPNLGSKKQNILSVEECLSKCVDDYECMALTYKVRLYEICTKA